jgi:hypothetical protein
VGGFANKSLLVLVYVAPPGLSIKAGGLNGFAGMSHH